MACRLLSVNLDDDTRQDQTRRYEALRAHYRTEPTATVAAWRMRAALLKARIAI
jgi:hypothetical protein